MDDPPEGENSGTKMVELNYYRKEMYQVTKKLQNVKQLLKVWNKTMFGRVETKKDNLKQKIKQIDTEIETRGLLKFLQNKEKVIIYELHNTLAQEEIKWR